MARLDWSVSLNDCWKTVIGEGLKLKKLTVCFGIFDKKILIETVTPFLRAELYFVGNS